MKPETIIDPESVIGVAIHDGLRAHERDLLLARRILAALERAGYEIARKPVTT